MSFSELQTPALLIDLDVVERNCSRMLQRADEWGARLRPHVKTHKTIEGALLQLGGSMGPVTVSTLAEAEAFAAAGFDDILWALPLDPSKASRVAELASKISTLGVLIDSREALEALESLSTKTRLTVWIKIDCGYHRAGLAPTDDLVIELARSILSSDRLDFGGLLTHAGHSYHGSSLEEIRSIARTEVEALQRASEAITNAGLPSPRLSSGSTPTATVGDLSGSDEIRPGNYIFFDAFQSRLGSCTLEDCAMSVLTTVIGAYPERSKLIVDAGALALSKDRGDGTTGYGIVCDEDGNEIEGLTLESLSQEHGEIAGSPDRLSKLRPGDRLRIIANHSCLTAACFEQYWITRDNRVVGNWTPTKGW